ncbi:hypothetical protein EJV46_19395 [Roseococcus sp. SYP-B2431]|uniref:hypothetical protein n=1 Tax=Roseococcus sp. SYP-B2431 TaxID=2496640 RepID=UPI00103947B1|nr:hypothetical protein [Roseococcus sp. SYP-B2431]TCH96743.1 hypothetical protein EJV46_19395 [Roseococcus sp. SYP-B2431]
MFAAIDGGLLGLAEMMAALGILPGILALASRKAGTPRLERAVPRPFHFGAATAARRMDHRA